jgi:hypothetical protein
VKVATVNNSQISPRWISPQSEGVCHLDTHIKKASTPRRRARAEARRREQERESRERSNMAFEEECSRRHWAAWQSDSWEVMWQLTAPVKHLTSRGQTKIFLEKEFTVSPKADGVRCLVLSEALSGRMCLIAANGVRLPLNAHSTPYVCGLERGFLLDAEMVETPTGANLVLAFDVLSSTLYLNSISMTNEHSGWAAHTLQTVICLNPISMTIPLFIPSTVMPSMAFLLVILVSLSTSNFGYVRFMNARIRMTRMIRMMNTLINLISMNSVG